MTLREKIIIKYLTTILLVMAKNAQKASKDISLENVIYICICLSNYKSDLEPKIQKLLTELTDFAKNENEELYNSIESSIMVAFREEGK